MSNAHRALLAIFMGKPRKLRLRRTRKYPPNFNLCHWRRNAPLCCSAELTFNNSHLEKLSEQMWSLYLVVEQLPSKTLIFLLNWTHKNCTQCVYAQPYLLIDIPSWHFSCLTRRRIVRIKHFFRGKLIGWAHFDSKNFIYMLCLRLFLAKTVSKQDHAGALFLFKSSPQLNRNPP